jgi:proteasome lid subunit RPN8/RPN11
VTYSITIPERIETPVRQHLLQNHLEQGAFLYAKVRRLPEQVDLSVVEFHLVPPEGWLVQEPYYLEMDDAERSRIMKRARDGGWAVIDCHSHPSSTAFFSPSDRRGAAEFAEYARWKLDGKPFSAVVWAPETVDAVVWDGVRQTTPAPIKVIRIVGSEERLLVPEATWSTEPQRPMGRSGHGR